MITFLQALYLLKRTQEGKAAEDERRVLRAWLVDTFNAIERAHRHDEGFNLLLLEVPVSALNKGWTNVKAVLAKNQQTIAALQAQVQQLQSQLGNATVATQFIQDQDDVAAATEIDNFPDPNTQPGVQTAAGPGAAGAAGLAPLK